LSLGDFFILYSASTIPILSMSYYQAIEQFFKSTGQQIEISTNDMAYFDEIFSHDKNDYSSVFFYKNTLMQTYIISITPHSALLAASLWV